jgi:hypothetical protein
MWSYNYNGRRSMFDERQRVLFSLGSNDRERKNLNLALKLGNYGIFIGNPDDSTQIASGMHHILFITVLNFNPCFSQDNSPGLSQSQE